MVGDENVEIRVSELRESPGSDPRNLHPDYKSFNANESHFKRLCRFYDARAEDRSWIFYQFRPSRLSIYIVVHKRVPPQEFKALLEDFYRQRSKTDVVCNENVEIRIRDDGDPDEDCLSDLQVENSGDPGDEGVKVDDG